MAHTPFKVGDVVSNKDIVREYRVDNTQGIRPSKTFNCIVLISKHTDNIYDDIWHGDILHYTGMGQEGDQSLKGRNKTLLESRDIGKELHLFEVFTPGEYTYIGIVKLVEAPYQNTQPDINGNNRKVWIFPVKLLSGDSAVSSVQFRALQERKQKQAEKMDLDALEKAAKSKSSSNPGTRKVSSTQIVRDPYVSEYAKRIAAGTCALCHQSAPFKDANGNPYLETHHVIWLSKGGADSIDNTVALCPNCHRKMHVVNDPADVDKLLKIAKANVL